MIDGGDSPVRRPDVAGVEIEGEMVLYDEARRQLHRLSPTASALWACLDGSGTLAEIAADLAHVYGADTEQVLADVIETARRFGDEGLLEGTGQPASPEDGEEDQPGPFVRDDPAPCRGRVGDLAVRGGSKRVGLAVNTPELLDAARAVLAPSLIEQVDVRPTVSIVATAAGRGRSLMWCYRSYWLLGRHRGLRRALQAAVALLSSYEPRPSGATRVGAMLAVRGDSAVLLSPETYALAAALAPRLREAGWRVADDSWVRVDLASGRVVVPPSSVTIDADALAALPSDPFDQEPPAPGTYAVAAWINTHGDGAGTPAARLARLANEARDLDGPALEGLQRLLDGAQWMQTPLHTGAVMEALQRATDK